MWLLGCLVGTALAQQPDDVDYTPPNTTVHAAVGTPLTLSLQGEQWFADQASFQVGLGTRAVDGGFDLGGSWAARWRPDFACFNCGGRVLATLGIGPGGLVAADLEGGPWGFVVGGDLDATGVYWFSSYVGFTLSVHGGVGAGWSGSDFSALEPGYWLFGGAGLAF
jgi:hypothetical protein